MNNTKNTMKIAIRVTYSEWEDGNGWFVRDTYYGIDDEYRDVSADTDLQKLAEECMKNLKIHDWFDGLGEDMLLTLRIETLDDEEEWQTAAEVEEWGKSEEE